MTRRRWKTLIQIWRIISHIYDEWRYVMMENPINPPIRQKVVRDVREDPLDLWKDSYTDNIGRYDYITY